MRETHRDQERRLAGSLLLLGFALLLLAGILFGLGAERSLALQQPQSIALAAGLVITLLGLVAFEFVFEEGIERVLARLGTIAFLVGAVLFMVGDGIALSGGQFVFEFERDYVVLACAAIALVGAAIVRAAVLRVWVGWMAIAWGIVFAALYLARLVEAPLGPNLMTGLFGLFLLSRPLPASVRRRPG